MGTPDARLAIFVASSDNTRDVFARVFPSLRLHWPRPVHPLYAGFNQPGGPPEGFVPIYAPAVGWGGELIAQLEQLETDYVLLLLDDFLVLRRVDERRLAQLVDLAVRRNLLYLRLIPVRRPLLARILHGLRRPAEIEPVPASDPYYSALQAVIWKRTYLLTCLGLEKNIWRFEELRAPMGEGRHFAVSRNAPIHYRHVVEKGRWLPDATWLMGRAGVAAELGRRPRWPLGYYVRRCARLVWFQIVGYSVMRIRRALGRRHSRTEPVRGS